MEDSTLAPGRTTICMAMGSTPGETAGVMRGITKWIKSTATVSTVGLTAAGMKAIGRMANSTVKVGI
jgi:hypothetical protein